MKDLASASRANSGLSILEILAVVAVLLMLAALFVPPASGPDRSRRGHAGMDVQCIVSGIKAYYTEYGFYPGESGSAASAAKSDRAVGDPAAGIPAAPNSALFDILRAIPSPNNPDSIYNPRKIVFIEAKPVPDPKHPRGGILDSADAPAGLKGCYFDPWGHQYCVVMDTNGDGQLDLAPFYKDFTGTSAPRTGVGAFSLGVDGQPGKKGNHRYRDGTDRSDDIVSWAN
jgi:type II secretory pathway pseudopilin PulG